MNQCPPGPQVFQRGRFEFLQKFVEIFANGCLSPVSMTLATSCSVVSTTPAKKLPAINPCHGFSVIASVVDIGDKFITGADGDNNTGNKFIAGD